MEPTGMDEPIDDSDKVVVPLVKDIIDRGLTQAGITVDENQIIAHLNDLDKNRLIEIYNQLITERNDITNWNYLLNKNTYKYFMRKKKSQALMKDHPEDVARLESNFKEKLSEFSEVISKHEKVRVDLLTRLDDLTNKRDKLFKVKQEAQLAFEDTVRDTGRSLKSLQSGQKLSPEALENIMSQILATRKNMSEIRLHFIKTLDRHTQMEVKANELQDLGNGLRMNDFSQLREERQCLEEKIEERNNTLEKLRLRCFSDTQILSHVREKKCMLEGTEEEEYQELKDVIHEMEITRNFMNDCNAKCEKLRKLYAETSTNCGLLDKPELLRNFDDTESEFKTIEENVEHLRLEINDINKKIIDATVLLTGGKNDTIKGILKKPKQINEEGTNATTKTNYISQSVLKIKPY